RSSTSGHVRARIVIVDHRGAHRRGSHHTGRYLPAHALEGPVPLKVPHTHYLHHDIVARRGRRGAAHGPASRRVLPWLLLASVRYPVPTRHHEYRRHGGYHANRIRRENAALWPPGASCPRSRARGVRCRGERGTPSPSHLPERWCGYACRNADENAWKRKRTCHEVTDPILDIGGRAVCPWHEADVSRRDRACPLWEAKGTLLGERGDVRS